MLLEKTNIERKLQRLKKKQVSEDSILEQVYTLISEDDETNETILTQHLSDSNAFVFDLLETENIYHIDQIKTICIDYRLRFLDTSYFKGKLPQEATNKVKHLEHIHQTELKGFKIIAPSKLFKLDNADDPLLFAPIGNGYYYLIHKWGNDLSPIRKWLMLPFRNFETLVFTTLFVSFLATLLVPNGLFSNTSTTAEFWMIFFFMFKSLAAVVIYYGFAAGKNFNTAIWDSKYFNT